MPGSLEDFVDTVPQTRCDPHDRVRPPNGREDDGKYFQRLAWTAVVLALYIVALVLPAAGFIGVGDGSSSSFVLRPWALVPGDVQAGWEMLVGGFIELFLGQVGAAGWLANVLFAVSLYLFWEPVDPGSRSRSMSSLMIVMIGLALVSLPLTNLAPILANEAGWKMAAHVPLAGYWFWLASMLTLWVALRVMPPLEYSPENDLPRVWTKRFALIEKAGGAGLPNKAALTRKEYIQVRLNFLALVFGAGYYIFKGMWKKGLTLGVIEMTVVSVLMTMAPQWHWVSWFVQGGFMFFFGTSANLDFYELTHGEGGVPTIHVRALSFASMMFIGWIEVLASDYVAIQASRPLASTEAEFPRIQTDERATVASPTGDASQEAMKQEKDQPHPSSAPPKMASPSAHPPRQFAAASWDSLPFHLGESSSEVRRTVASLPDLSAADFNTQEARFMRQGIWLFFDPSQQVREIRLDAPFGGAIQGIHIGDPISTLLTVLGNPDVPLFAFAGDLAYVYDRSGVAYRFDVGKDARVERVFILPERI